MKRELKVPVARGATIFQSASIAKVIPMKRELKGALTEQHETDLATIAKVIPMKRELKDDELFPLPGILGRDRKGNPDEKGTACMMH